MGDIASMAVDMEIYMHPRYAIARVLRHMASSRTKMNLARMPEWNLREFKQQQSTARTSIK